MSFTPILLSTELSDNPVSITASSEATGFPVELLLAPRPRAKWLSNNVTTAQIQVQLSLFQQPVAINTFSLLFMDDVSGVDVTAMQWRIQVGSGGSLYDSGTIPVWDPPLVSPVPVIDRGGYKFPEFYQGGIHAHHYLGENILTPNGDNITITLSNQGGGAQTFSAGRLVIGRALEPLVVYGSGLPTPVGSPPKLVNTWDALLTQEQIESIAYAMAFDRRSSPRTLTSWGGEISLLDGAKTLVMVNDVAAPNPWTRHQGTVYGYLDQISPIEISAFEEYRTRITVRGM